MLTSLFTGVSGMNAHMDELSVVGHNIANMNTYGFKGSRSYFADLLSQSLEGITGPNQIGAGVEMNAVVKTFSQGAFETTASLLLSKINAIQYVDSQASKSLVSVIW